MALTDKLTAIANAIRAKTGKTAKMTMAEMATEITNIPQTSTGEADGIIMRTATSITNDTATKVASYAFYNNSTLKSASFTAATSVERVGFYYATALSSINLPKATYCGGQSFSSCTSLTSASFLALTEIGTYAFEKCKNLKALVLGNASQVCSLANTNAFTNTPIASGTGYIYVPDALVDSYKAATNWSTYAAQIKPLSEYTGG